MTARLAIALIRLYQRTISRLLPPVCRFTPTCSEYMARAIAVHGFFKGLWLGCNRICRCNPFNPGGYDPVPGDTKCTDGVCCTARATEVTEIE